MSWVCHFGTPLSFCHVTLCTDNLANIHDIMTFYFWHGICIEVSDNLLFTIKIRIMPKIRTIDTIDGEVKCRYCYDIDNSMSYIEFNLRSGYADESDPYEYVGESDYIEDFDNLTDEQLEEMYYEFCN